MLIYSQRNPAWSKHPLGWGPNLGTIGSFGCYETDFAMILTDTGHQFSPASLDELLTQRRLFMREPTGTFDLLSNNTLDVLFPGEYQTTQIAGFDAPGIAKAVPSSDTYAIFFISTARVPTHFVIAWSPNGGLIADPWTGTVVGLASYGGPGAVQRTIYVRHIKPTPTPVPPPPPPVQPLPVPTEPVYDLYSFDAEGDNRPLTQVTTEADAITQADNWSSENNSAAIRVIRGGEVIYDLAAGVVPTIR